MRFQPPAIFWLGALAMRHRLTNRWQWGASMALMLLALVTAACASTSSVTTQPTPGGFQRGVWQRPQFPGVSAPTVATVGFADGDQRVGYACSATLMSNGTATPTSTGTPTATPQTNTPTPVLPGGATPLPQGTVISNFWRTADGGMTWQTATLPTTTNGLLCPISAVSAPDVTDPQDVFFLAAFGDLNLQNPSSIEPGQVRFELWRSQDGAQTWKQLALPVAPNPINPV